MPHQHMPSGPDYDNAIPRTQNLVPGAWLPRPHVSSNRNPNEMPYNVIEHSARSSIASYAPDGGYLTVGPNQSLYSNSSYGVVTSPGHVHDDGYGTIEPNQSLYSDSSYGVVTSPGHVHMRTRLPEVSTISHDANMKENRTHSTRHILLALGVATLIIIGIVGVGVYVGSNGVDRLSEGSSHDPEKKVEPVDGIWSNWYESGQCSTTCGNGTIALTRICNNPPSSNGGQECGNMYTNVTTCKVVDCCPVDGYCNATCVSGSWESWTVWSECSTSCRPSVSSRSRVCANPGSGEWTGSVTVTKDCQTLKCYDNWGNWSACSFTCGTGIKTRNRTCDGKYTGQECGVQYPTFLDQTYCTNTQLCSGEPFCKSRQANCSYTHPNRRDLFIECDPWKYMFEKACNVLMVYNQSVDCVGGCIHADI